jgi:hypothetical protein
MFKTLKPIDLATLGLVTVVASTGVPAWLGLQDRLSIAALTMGLACPAARRLIAWRRGAEPLRFGTGRGSTGLVLLAMLPWVVLPGLRVLPWEAVASIGTARLDLPMAVRIAGVVFAVGGVLLPMVGSLRGTDRIRSAAPVETFGLFLATGNLFLGALAVAWTLANLATTMPAARRSAQAGPVLA